MRKEPDPEHQKIDNRTLYDENWGDWADTKIYGPGNRYLQFLIKRAFRGIDLATIASILDVGCGTGINTYLLAQMIPGAHVTGIDFSGTGIAYAQNTWKLPNLAFYHDVKSERLADMYDLVSCFEVLEHIADWRGFLKRISLSAKTYLLLSFPTGRMRDFEVNVGHLRNFRKGEVEAYLKTLNFTPVLIQNAGFPFYSPIFRDLSNLVNLNSKRDPFSRGEYGLVRKFLSQVCYISFCVLSTKRHWGDKSCSFFVKVNNRERRRSG